MPSWPAGCLAFTIRSVGLGIVCRVPIAASLPVLVAASVVSLVFAGLITVPASASAAATTPIAITEWEYNGSEFVEFTNIDTVSVDLTGWSFSDSAAVAGSVSLGSLGTVLPGESFILSEASATDFRAAWGLPSAIKVLGGNPQNLGRNDAINLYDNTNTLVDSLTYNDAGTGSVRGPRTDTASAWPNSSADLFGNNASAWTRSTANDAELSWTSATGGYIASPGLSRFGSALRWLLINEINSSTDTVEIANASPAPVNIAGWTQTDSGHSPGALTGLSATTVPARGYVTFTSNQGLSGGGDAVRLFLADGTSLIDSVAYGANEAEPGSWSRCPDSTGASFVHAATSTFGAVNNCSVAPVDPGTPATDPNWADIVINEITSDNDSIGFAPRPTLGDGIELYNTGTHNVSVEGWKQVDSGAAAAAAVFSAGLYVNGALATVIPAGGFGVFQSTKGLSSGGDAVKIYTPDGTLVDELTYGAGQAGVDETVNSNHDFKSLARCADGSEAVLKLKTATFGASNVVACATGVPPVTGGSGPEAACNTEDGGTAPGAVPAGALTWPGSQPVTIDAACAWVTTESGQDLSGLAFDPSNSNVLYAVKNKSHVWRLVKSGTSWVNDTANGWANGKALRFPGGTGSPDTEGITVGPDGALYITTERDNAASGVPLDSILRFDPNASGTTLSATDQWVLTADLGFTNSSDANLGFEGVTYVPDSFLVNAGFRTDAGVLYNPANYPGKAVAGLFFGAVEKNGHLIAYALNTDHSFARVADISTGMVGVMEATFDADLGRIWAHCDNTCGNTTALLTVDSSGAFVVDRHYATPANLPNYNLEGFAVAPASTAVGGQRQVLWADDGNRFGHSLWAGTIPVDLALSRALSLSSTSAAPGQQITLTVTGLTPGDGYEAVLNSAPMLLGSGIANGNGVLRLTVTIPRGATVGAHTITIAAVSTPSAILASAAFTVTGSLALTGPSSPPSLLSSALVLLFAGAGVLLGRRSRFAPLLRRIRPGGHGRALL